MVALRQIYETVKLLFRAVIPMTEFIGLRSKMYSYIKDNNQGGKTAKGIKKKCSKERYYT